MSKADCASLFAQEIGLSSKLLNRSLVASNQVLVARRPLDMRMNSKHFENHLGVDLPTMAEEIHCLAKVYTNDAKNKSKLVDY